MYRIFIVEDDETIAKMVAKHLEKWDYEVWTVKMQTAGTFESVKHRIVCKMSGDYIACFYADLLSGSGKASQSAALFRQSYILRMGRTCLCDSYAFLQRI